jgi:hypothetical protein
MITAAEIAKRLSCGESGCGCNKEISPGTWRTHCPLRGRHENNDRTPSFDVTDKGDKILVNCKGGCTQADIISVLKEMNLWPSQDGGDRPQVDGGLTLADFAQAKQLDPSFLAKHGVTQATGLKDVTKH